MSKGKTEGDGLTRLSFLKASAGAAAGAAAIGVPAAVIATEQPGVVTEPSSATPRETVMAGTSETTYRDRALVKKLLAAAPKDSVVNGGGIDVLAP
jgi:hypothetical protein